MEPVPPFRGIRKVAESQRESTGISANFLYFMVCRSSSPIPYKGKGETLDTSEMRSLVCLILCFAPSAIAGGGQSAQPVPGKVTLVYFHADWCGPCKRLTPALEKLAASDADIALRKIDLTNGGSEDYNIMALPVVKLFTFS
jgi:thiol-disulfide isomerase/thioredoxin